jgi:hypothetical protein
MEAQRMQGCVVAHRAWQAGLPTAAVVEQLQAQPSSSQSHALTQFELENDYLDLGSLRLSLHSRECHLYILLARTRSSRRVASAALLASGHRQ